MRRRLPSLFVSLVLGILAALPAAATDFSGGELVIPVVGRTPGAAGSMWQSDLVLINRSKTKQVTIEARMFVVGSPEKLRVYTLAPYATRRIADFVQSEFQWASTVGILELRSTTGDPFSAHALVYNTGNAVGRFGQSVPAIPKTQLGKQNVISGLTGIDGNRSNVGIANPNDVPAHMWLLWYDRNGESHGSVSIAVEPHTLRMYDDIYDKTGVVPDDGMIFEVRSDIPVYAWGSVARNDTGDAYFLIGESNEAP